MVCGLDCDWPRPKTIKLGLGQAKSVVKVADNCLSRPLTGLAVHTLTTEHLPENLPFSINNVLIGFPNHQFLCHDFLPFLKVEMVTMSEYPYI